MILSLMEYASLRHVFTPRLTANAPNSVAEQFIGIVVSCMPILPAFLRHTSKHSQKRYAVSSVKKNINSSILRYQSGRSKASKAQPKDPYPLDVTRGYYEIDDVEAHMQATGLGGIVREVEISVFVEHVSRPCTSYDFQIG